MRWTMDIIISNSSGEPIYQQIYNEVIKEISLGLLLPQEKIAEFENKYRKLLDKYEEPLKLKHQIHIEIYRVKK